MAVSIPSRENDEMTGRDGTAAGLDSPTGDIPFEDLDRLRVAICISFVNKARSGTD